MAQVVKAKKKKQVVEIEQKEEKSKKTDTRVVQVEKNTEQKNNLWVRFRIFCHGVRQEAKVIHWTKKEDLLKYSIITIIFIIFFALFFYGVDALFAFIRSLLSK